MSVHIISLLLLAISATFAEEQNWSPFGHSMLKQFTMDPNYTNLNHGSYGTVPRVVQESAERFRKITEANPDQFYRFDVFTYLDDARDKVAAIVGVEPEDLVLIPNASEGMNAILKGLVSSIDTAIIYLDLEYFMCAETMRYLRDTLGVSLYEVSTEELFPATDADAFKSGLITAVKNMLETVPDDKKIVCSFSHITSMPAIVLPIADLSNVCHEAGALVAVDGAHVLGNIPVHIPSTGADVYVSNGHKWSYTSKGSAFLWVSKALQPTTNPYTVGRIQPVIISNEGLGESPYATLFSWEGTKDYAAFLSMPSALTFRATYGEENIMSYTRNLAAEGGALLAEALGTRMLVPQELLSSMVNVEVPTNTSNCNPGFSKALLDEYNTYVPVVVKSDRCWVRVSAQIYTEISDFQYIADSIIAILDKSAPI